MSPYRLSKNTDPNLPTEMKNSDLHISIVHNQEPAVNPIRDRNIILLEFTLDEIMDEVHAQYLIDRDGSLDDRDE